MTTTKNAIDDVLSLSDYFPEMAKRELALKKSTVTDVEAVVIGKGCVMHVLAALREAGAETAFDFAWLMHSTPVKQVPNIRYPLTASGKKLLLERVFVEQEYQDNPRSMIGTERYRALEALYDTLGYKTGNEIWDEGVHAVIDECIEVTTDNEVVFNEARVLALLDPIERNRFVRQQSSCVPVGCR